MLYSPKRQRLLNLLAAIWAMSFITGFFARLMHSRTHADWLDAITTVSGGVILLTIAAIIGVGNFGLMNDGLPEARSRIRRIRLALLFAPVCAISGGWAFVVGATKLLQVISGNYSAP